MAGILLAAGGLVLLALAVRCFPDPKPEEDPTMTEYQTSDDGQTFTSTVTTPDGISVTVTTVMGQHNPDETQDEAIERHLAACRKIQTQGQ